MSYLRPQSIFRRHSFAVICLALFSSLFLPIFSLSGIAAINLRSYLAGEDLQKVYLASGEAREWRNGRSKGSPIVQDFELRFSAGEFYKDRAYALRFSVRGFNQNKATREISAAMVDKAELDRRAWMNQILGIRHQLVLSFWNAKQELLQLKSLAKLLSKQLNVLRSGQRSNSSPLAEMVRTEREMLELRDRIHALNAKLKRIAKSAEGINFESEIGSQAPMSLREFRNFFQETTSVLEAGSNLKVKREQLELQISKSKVALEADYKPLNFVEIGVEENSVFKDVSLSVGIKLPFLTGNGAEVSQARAEFAAKIYEVETEKLRERSEMDSLYQEISDRFKLVESDEIGAFAERVRGYKRSLRSNKGLSLRLRLELEEEVLRYEIAKRERRYELTEGILIWMVQTGEMKLKEGASLFWNDGGA